MDAVLANIADSSSLAMDDIPVKLRCAACNKLATNAFRQSSLPQACPICLHEPVKAEDCRPNKTLRMTIKAFLKKLMTEREKIQKKQAAEKAAATQAALQPSEHSERPPSTAHDTAATTQPTRDADVVQPAQKASSIPPIADSAKPSQGTNTMPTEAQKDVPQPSIEVRISLPPSSILCAYDRQTSEDHVREESFQEQAQGEGAVSDPNGPQKDGPQALQEQQSMLLQGAGQQWPNVNGAGQGMNGAGTGFDGMSNGFPNMAFANPGDFNSMMQFMPNNAMGGFPNMMGMPGMPGMGMDPMQAMSQGMFGGFGGPGMGMNGMNGGMGFPVGQGWNGGFNGQPGAWMSGQDKFNQNAYGGHANGMGGDFGANAGYSGYNVPSHQGNYNQMNQHQFPNHDFQNGYHGQGFHNRGRGRGRGYSYASRGRGGYNQVMSGNQANHEPYHHQYSTQHVHQDGAQLQHQQQSQEADNPQVDEFGRDTTKHTRTEEATDEQIARELAPGDRDESPEAAAAAPSEEAKVSTDLNGEPREVPPDGVPALPGSNEPDLDSKKPIDNREQESEPARIETFASDEQIRKEPTQPSPAVNSSAMMPPPTPTSQQAPQSFPQVEVSHEYSARPRGLSRGLPRGPADFHGAGRGRVSRYASEESTTNHVKPAYQPALAPVIAPIEPKGLGVEGAPKGPKAMREGLPNTAIRGGRGFSIVGRASSAVHGRPNGQARSRRVLIKSPAALLPAHAPLLDTDPTVIALTATAHPVPRKQVSRNANAAANVIAVALVNMKNQTKRRNRELLLHTGPPTEAGETAQQNAETTKPAPTIAHTALAANANTTATLALHANAPAHLLLSTHQRARVHRSARTGTAGEE
ncbi:MAG: hypothetical protein Q9170_007356 [Blastenia crenularia]